MKKIFRLFLFVCIILCSVPGLAQSLNTLTIETLNKRIEVAQGSQEYDPETQAELIQLYRDSISQLHLHQKYTQAIAEYQALLVDAPKEIATLKEIQNKRFATDPLAELKTNQFSNQAVLEKQISDEEINRSTVEAKLTSINSQIEANTLRPSQARTRINSVRLEMAELNDKKMDQQANIIPVFTEANYWYWDTKYQTLQTELTMLDQELVSNSLLLNLLREKQQNETALLKSIETRIAFLRENIYNKRAETVRKISESANSVLNGTLAEDRYLSFLARQNLQLIEELHLQIEELQALLEKDNKERKLTLAVSEAFHNARKKLQLQSDSSFIALSIRAQREKLSNNKEYKKTRNIVLADIAKISLRLFNYEEMLNKYDVVNEEVSPQSTLPDQVNSIERDKVLSELLENRKMLLARAITNDQVQQRRLYDLAARYLQLIDTTKSYDDYLTEHLLWIQSTQALNFVVFTQLPVEIKKYTTHLTTALLGLKALSLRDLFALFMPFSLAILLIFFRSNLLAALKMKAEKVGHVKYDSILHTIKALIYTTLLALPWALILFTISWAIRLPETASNISFQLASAGAYTAVSLFSVHLIKMICIEEGVAEIHFNRNKKGLSTLVKQLDLFIYFAVPCYFIMLSAIELFPATLGGSLAIIGYIGVMFTLVRTISRILHPSKGLIYQTNISDPKLSLQTRNIIFFFIMSIPIAIVIMYLAGYNYTAGVVSDRLYFSILFAAIVWIFHSLLSRWLLITSKRLAYDNLVIARKAKLDRLRTTESDSDSENPDLNHDEPLENEVDLKILDGDTQKLINAATLVLAVMGLVGIWEQMLPALSFLEHVDLWNKTLTVNGKEVLIAVTLYEVLTALFIAFAGYLLSQNLPSLLDIILLKRGKITPGSRYTIITLTRYSTVIITILITMTLLGISSANLGWMFAALSVGIGFGLQEIVANFICGLILLFERPIRVGDVITIGNDPNSSGTVIRIRIRATTIRDFDEKELLIPNKELITGRVLNWTLSDEITRIFINVGIAYGSDVELAMSIIEQVALDNQRTLEDPAPFVNFEKFADSSLSLTLRTYVPTQRDRLRTITDLHKEIDKRFRIAKIVIAFPRQDIRIIPHETLKSTE